jgi:hypothetical protein
LFPSIHPHKWHEKKKNWALKELWRALISMLASLVEVARSDNKTPKYT